MKYRPIFITATNTDIGKTYTTCKLIEEFGKRGLKVGVLKPIETGVIKEPLDGRILYEAAKKTNPTLENFSLEDIVPVRYSLPAAPYIAKKDEVIDMTKIHQAFEKLSLISDIVLIEGAGGVMVPVEEEFYMYDFIKEFNAVTLLVTHGNLGCINDVLLNVYFLDSLGIEYEWCVNLKQNVAHFEEITLPFYQKSFPSVLVLQNDCERIVEKLLK
jgi:dethiobiotin synthetase